MSQLNFVRNFPSTPSYTYTVTPVTASFVPMLVPDNISLLTANVKFFDANGANSTNSVTLSLGLYSLSGNTLSIANSLSRSYTLTNLNNNYYISLIATSIAQNISAGVWYWGFLFSKSTAGGNNKSIILAGGATVNPVNAFPGIFIGGRMTVSTAALPATYATSDLDVTGNDAMQVPLIILSS